MEPTKKAAKDALKFMAKTMNDPDMPPETRRKCAETILSRVISDGKEQPSPRQQQAVSVTYQVIE